MFGKKKCLSYIYEKNVYDVTFLPISLFKKIAINYLSKIACRNDYNDIGKPFDCHTRNHFIGRLQLLSGKM